MRWFHGVVHLIKEGRPTEFDIGLTKMLDDFRVPYYVVQNRFQQVCDSYDVHIDNRTAVDELVRMVKHAVHKEFTKGRASQCSYSRIFMINSRKWEFADGRALADAIRADIMRGIPDEPPADRPVPQQ